MKNFTKAFVALATTFLFATQSSAQTASTTLSYTTDDYVTLPNNVLDGVTGDFTIEAWVYWNGPTGTQWHRIFDFGGGTSKYMYLTPAGRDPVTNTNRLLFAISEFGNCCEQRILAPAELTPNAWHHIAVTLDNTNNIGTLYLDGVAVGTNNSMSYDVNTILPTTQNWIGRSQFAGDPFFEGRIDEFRISNIVRYTSGFTPQRTQFSTDANTVALYHFNEGSGQTSADASANGFNATLGATSSPEASDPTWTTGSILPINITQFSARKSNGSIDLKWTATVTGNGGQIIIERSSDGNSFQSIGTINVAANAGTSNYGFSDRQFVSGRNHYRLRITEAGVADKYSSVVVVDADRRIYSAYPTNATSQIYIKIPKATTVAIYNNIGVMVKKIELQASQNINISDLSKGVYQLQFEGSKETVRFVKM